MLTQLFLDFGAFAGGLLLGWLCKPWIRPNKPERDGLQEYLLGLRFPVEEKSGDSGTDCLVPEAHTVKRYMTRDPHTGRFIKGDVPNVQEQD